MLYLIQIATITIKYIINVKNQLDMGVYKIILDILRCSNRMVSYIFGFCLKNCKIKDYRNR